MNTYLKQIPDISAKISAKFSLDSIFVEKYGPLRKYLWPVKSNCSIFLPNDSCKFSRSSTGTSFRVRFREIRPHLKWIMITLWRHDNYEVNKTLIITNQSHLSLIQYNCGDRLPDLSVSSNAANSQTFDQLKTVKIHASHPKPHFCCIRMFSKVLFHPEFRFDYQEYCNFG